MGLWRLLIALSRPVWARWLYTRVMVISSTRTLHGVSVPAFFYGTAWKEERTEALTRQALAAGFRAIDTANQRRHYFEAAVGDALSGASIARADLFIQTKFTYVSGQDHRLPYDRNAPPATQVEQSFQSSLEHLRTPYIDSYILHGPSLAEGLSTVDRQVWRAMSALQQAGKTRLIGISNVSIAQLEGVCEFEGAKPAFVQNRCYARTGWDREVRDFCRANDIEYQGFSLLTANRRALAQPTIGRIMVRADRTLAQVVFRFALQSGMFPLTGTSDPVHLRQDLESFDFELSEDEMVTIERIEVS